MIEIVVATTNWGKLKEIKELCKNLKELDFVSLSQFSGYVQPEETGLTFMENALLKAEHAAKTLGKLVIAEDSGLVVPALEGRPGVKSRRYSGEEATDAENNLKLREELTLLPEDSRAGYYECAVVLASPEKVIRAVSATCEGCLILEERGRHGFGYDPLFIKNGYEKTFAELGVEIKNKISHRSKAFGKLLPALELLAR